MHGARRRRRGSPNMLLALGERRTVERGRRRQEGRAEGLRNACSTCSSSASRGRALNTVSTTTSSTRTRIAPRCARCASSSSAAYRAFSALIADRPLLEDNILLGTSSRNRARAACSSSTAPLAPLHARRATRSSAPRPRRLGGAMLNTCVRDSATLARLPIGTRPLGTCPRPRQTGAGRIGVPVTFGGIELAPAACSTPTTTASSSRPIGAPTRASQDARPWQRRSPALHDPRRMRTRPRRHAPAHRRAGLRRRRVLPAARP